MIKNDYLDELATFLHLQRELLFLLVLDEIDGTESPYEIQIEYYQIVDTHLVPTYSVLSIDLFCPKII